MAPRIASCIPPRNRVLVFACSTRQRGVSFTSRYCVPSGLLRAPSTVGSLLVPVLVRNGPYTYINIYPTTGCRIVLIVRSAANFHTSFHSLLVRVFCRSPNPSPTTAIAFRAKKRGLASRLLLDLNATIEYPKGREAPAPVRNLRFKLKAKGI